MIGSSVTQTPTASKTAAAIAGGWGLFAISPIPFAPYGPSADGFSMMIVSTCGRSSMPGREVRAELAAAMLDARVVRVAVLEHAEPEAHDRAALDLTLDERRVDRPADVEALDEPRHAHLARLVVDLDLGRAGGVRDRGVRRQVDAARLGIHDRRVGLQLCPVPVISSP